MREHAVTSGLVSDEACGDPHPPKLKPGAMLIRVCMCVCAPSGWFRTTQSLRFIGNSIIQILIDVGMSNGKINERGAMQSVGSKG